jgi:hypothetical protein
MEGNLVNLFIVGAAKCGTTSLYEYLAQHPQIYMCPVKEPHFFSDKVENANKDLYRKPEKGKKYHTKIVKDPDVYAALFDEGKNAKIRGEASPSYLWDPDAALKIFKYNPDAKIIVVLRDPIDRLVSAYQMDYASGKHDETDFLETVKKAYEKKDKIWGLDRIYLELGFYYEQLSRYSKLFPAEQLLIVKFNDLTRKTGETLTTVLNFLDVDVAYLKNVDLEKKYNESVSIKYPFLRRIRQISLFRFLFNSFGKQLSFIKKFTHKKGYGLKIVISKETENYLNNIYHDDLVKLKIEYNIDF